MTDLPRLAASTPNLPCRPNPEPWYSDNASDRMHAVRQCLGCPLQQACAAYAIEQREPWGVWGGTTTADRRGFWDGRPWRLDDLGRLRLVCGSEEAYRAHFSYREQPCEGCTVAHEALVEADRRRRLDEEHAAGGSVRGYQIHRVLGEEACGRCKAAQARMSARQRAQRGRTRLRVTSGVSVSADPAHGVPGGAQPASCAA